MCRVAAAVAVAAAAVAVAIVNQLSAARRSARAYKASLRLVSPRSESNSSSSRGSATGPVQWSVARSVRRK